MDLPLFLTIAYDHRLFANKDCSIRKAVSGSLSFLFVFSESLLHNHGEDKGWGIILYKLSNYKCTHNYVKFTQQHNCWLCSLLLKSSQLVIPPSGILSVEVSFMESCKISRHAVKHHGKAEQVGYYTVGKIHRRAEQNPSEWILLALIIWNGA